MMFYKGNNEDLKNKYQIPNLLGILCYLLMKCFYYMCMFKEKPLKEKQFKIFRWINYFLFIIWNTLFSFSVSLLCNQLEDRAFIISQNLLIYQEIYFFLKLDFKQPKYIKVFPVLYSTFISGIVTRSLQSLSEQSLIWSDVILFLTNSCFILVVSFLINDGFENQDLRNLENTGSKIHTGTQKQKYDKKNEEFDQRESKIGNLNKSKDYNKEGSNGVQLNKKQNMAEDNKNHHEINGQNQQQLKNNGAYKNLSQQDKFQSLITLKNIEAEDLQKTLCITDQLDTHINKFISSNIKPSNQKQMNKNGILGYLKNGNNFPKAGSSSFLQNARNFDDQITKSQNDISFNNTVNKREKAEETSNNILLQDYYSVNQFTSQNTTQPLNYEAQSQPTIPSTSSNKRKCSLKKNIGIQGDILQNQDYILNNRSKTVGNQNDIINHQNKSLLQQVVQSNRIASIIDNLSSPINNLNNQSINNDSNMSSELQNQRTNKRELTAVFRRDEQSLKDISDSYRKNNQTIDKSSDCILMSDFASEYEISYNILNNVDFAAIKMDISGSWKVDFHNQAARDLIDKNRKEDIKDIASIFKKITIISLSKESQNTINNLGLMNKDYKFSPQIKHTSLSRQNEPNKNARSSIQKQDQSSQNGIDSFLSPARKIEFSIMKLPANVNPNFSLKQSSTQETNNTYQMNSISKATLNNKNSNQMQSPSSFNSMSVYQFINNIRNSIKNQAIDISQSINNSQKTKSVQEKGCQRILIETFQLEENVELFSNEDIIKIFIVNNKYIIVIIENMQQYYNSAKNQVAKTIQNGMLKTISHEIGTHLSILFSILNVCLLDSAISDQTKGILLYYLINLNILLFYNIFFYSLLIQNDLKQLEEYLIPFQQNMMLIYLLIQDFKDYQDILLDRFSIKLVKSDIKILLKEALELVSKQAKEKKIQININIEDNIQNMIHIDKIRFKQILINLLQNSLKFTGQNKQIDVSMKYSSQDQEKIQIIVQDQGIGMDEDEQKALNTLLQGGVCENKISLKSSGYGFGLTVSNKIALKLNEEIKYGTGNTPENKKKKSLTQNYLQGLQFESTPKVGSKFWFYINIAKSDLIDQQQQQLMVQSQVSLNNNNKKYMQASLMGFGDQYIEIEKNSQYTKMTSLIHDFKNTNQADSVFFDDLHRRVESRINFNSANPSPKLSVDHKTSSLKNSRQTNLSQVDNNSNQYKNIQSPLTCQTNLNNYQLSVNNSSNGQQSPSPLPFRINRVNNSNSTFSFNNAGSNAPNRNVVNENSKYAFESHFKNMQKIRKQIFYNNIEHFDETISYGQEQDDQQLERSDHIKPIPSSQIGEKVYDVLRAKKCSDTQNISQEKNDFIISLKNINSNINEMFQQQKSEMILSSPNQNSYILIVDDTQSNHNCLILYLERIYKISRQFILQAYNGKEGFEMFVQHQNQIQLIFMDLNMPILEGKEATQKIREYERKNNLESIAIVAYTAYSDPSTENECLNEYEFNYFLPKPIVDRSKLTDILEKTNIIN